MFANFFLFLIESFGSSDPIISIDGLSYAEFLPHYPIFIGISIFAVLIIFGVKLYKVKKKI